MQSSSNINEQHIWGGGNSFPFAQMIMTRTQTDMGKQLLLDMDNAFLVFGNRPKEISLLLLTYSILLLVYLIHILITYLMFPSIRTRAIMHIISETAIFLPLILLLLPLLIIILSFPYLCFRLMTYRLPLHLAL